MTDTAAERAAIRFVHEDGRAYTLHLGDLGPADDRVARAQCGFPVSGQLNATTFGTDSIVALIWMARRKNGEPNLTYAAVEAEYPRYEDLREPRLVVEEILEGDDPEG